MAAIAFVQANGASIPAQTTNAVTFTSAQTAGDLNVAVVSWKSSTATVTSVTDSRGNTYALAVGPTTSTGNTQQSIYYAKNIVSAAAGANTVSATFSTAIASELRVLEYSGINTTAPLDVTATATGTGTIANSGNATTTNANDLLVGAAYMQINSVVGAGYTQRLLVDGDMVEDRIVSATGSYSATVSQSSSGYWIMQLAAFKAGDVQSPTAPTGLTATAASSSQINLSWTASTDNVAVTGYLLERCSGASCTTFAQIATPTTTSYNDTGLTPSTSYSYRVRAKDAANNLSTYSSTATANTQGSAPGLVGAYSLSEGSGTTTADSSGNTNTGTLSGASWTASGKFGAGLSYDATTEILTVPSSTSLSPTAQVSVEAWIKPVSMPTTNAQARVVSKFGSYELTVSTGDTGCGFGTSGDAQWRAVLGGVDARICGGTISLNAWHHLAGTYNGTTFALYVDGVLAASVSRSGAITTNSAAVSIGNKDSLDRPFSGSLDEVRIYNRGLSAAEVTSDMNAPIGGGAGDTQAPTAPSGLSATAASGTQMNLSWTASTDNVAVTGYQIERCTGASCTTFTQVGTSATTTYGDSALTASTTYRYRVRATDAANNLSAYSSIANGTTQAGGSDTQAPTAPTSLNANASGTQVALTWTASTDNVGVTGYVVERCAGASCTTFAAVGTPAGTTYNDTGLSASTTYRYRVLATDAASNVSGYSNIASATTGAAPTAPSNLALIAGSASEIDIGWTASTGGTGTLTYRVERCQGVGCGGFTQIGTSTTTTFFDTNVSAGTNYSYRVRASDSSNTPSSYSSVLSTQSLATASCD